MIKIEINCEPSELTAHLEALRPTVDIQSFMPDPPANGGYSSADKVVVTSNGGYSSADKVVVTSSEDVAAAAFLQGIANATTGETGSTSPSGRIHGKPKPGRRQRSREEIAEDEAYFAGRVSPQPADTSKNAQRLHASKDAQVTVVDPQDAADEQAERDAKKSDTLTLDDVNEAVMRYTQAHGVPAAVENVPKLIGRNVADLPTDDQAALKAAIDKIDWAAAQPKDVKPNGDATGLFDEAPKPATRDDVIEALKRYALKYDGHDDVRKAVNTGTDIVQVLKQIFGDKVNRLGEMPQTPEAFRVLTIAIDEALAKNTFNRAAK